LPPEPEHTVEEAPEKTEVISANAGCVSVDEMSKEEELDVTIKQESSSAAPADPPAEALE